MLLIKWKTNSLGEKQPKKDIFGTVDDGGGDINTTNYYK